MAQLVVRNIDDDVKERLRQRAARHGHSMEEEVRIILREAVGVSSPVEYGLGTEIAELFRGFGLEAPIRRDHDEPEPASFPE